MTASSARVPSPGGMRPAATSEPMASSCASRPSSTAPGSTRIWNVLWSAAAPKDANSAVGIEKNCPSRPRRRATPHQRLLQPVRGIAVAVEAAAEPQHEVEGGGVGRRRHRGARRTRAAPERRQRAAHLGAVLVEDLRPQPARAASRCASCRGTRGPARRRCRRVTASPRAASASAQATICGTWLRNAAARSCSAGVITTGRAPRSRHQREQPPRGARAGRRRQDPDAPVEKRRIRCAEAGRLGSRHGMTADEPIEAEPARLRADRPLDAAHVGHDRALPARRERPQQAEVGAGRRGEDDDVAPRGRLRHRRRGRGDRARAPRPPQDRGCVHARHVMPGARRGRGRWSRR